MIMIIGCLAAILESVSFGGKTIILAQYIKFSSLPCNNECVWVYSKLCIVVVIYIIVYATTYCTFVLRYN